MNDATAVFTSSPLFKERKIQLQINLFQPRYISQSCLLNNCLLTSLRNSLIRKNNYVACNLWPVKVVYLKLLELITTERPRKGGLCNMTVVNLKFWHLDLFFMWFLWLLFDLYAIQSSGRIAMLDVSCSFKARRFGLPDIVGSDLKGKV